MSGILIGGDLVPTMTNSHIFKTSAIESLLDNALVNEFRNAEYNVVNLEAPLTNTSAPIKKSGPCLKADCGCINGLKAMGIHAVTLANNHIMDYGNNGLANTEQLLKEHGIQYFGAGKNLNNASRHLIYKLKNGKKIGFYGCAEHEFSIANETESGANPFDPLESLDHISEIKKNCDYVIVLYHGGKEYYRYPSPYLQKVCRKMVEKGADVVICQHSHCIGAFEIYQDSLLVYGQGNFLFDGSDSEYWKTSVLVKLNFSKDGLCHEFIPIVKNGLGVKKAMGHEAERILNGFLQRSQLIKDKAFVQKQYDNYCSQIITDYFGVIRGYKLWVALLNKIFGNTKLVDWYSDRELLSIRNVIECEAHREILINYIKNKIKE